VTPSPWQLLAAPVGISPAGPSSTYMIYITGDGAQTRYRRCLKQDGSGCMTLAMIYTLSCSGVERRCYTDHSGHPTTSIPLPTPRLYKQITECRMLCVLSKWSCLVSISEYWFGWQSSPINTVHWAMSTNCAREVITSLYQTMTSKLCSIRDNVKSWGRKPNENNTYMILLNTFLLLK
jgi:hypothetical protein